MAKIEYVAKRKEVLELPNCFCGSEPELIDDFDEVGDYRYRYVYVKCPYCNAQANEGRGYNTFNPYLSAVEKAAEDWIKMIERRKK